VTFDVLPEAYGEADAAAAWYEARMSHGAARFLQALTAAFQLIERQPHSFGRVRPPGSRRNYRQYVLRRFDYSVVYEIRPGEVLVIAVAHNSRRQYYWRHRRKP
jgi:toxin ParE1/3/4